MTTIEARPLDLSHPRYWHQNAKMSVRDVIDALIELITNADDRYVWLTEHDCPASGRIEIEIERHRGAPTYVHVRDFADGMTNADMEQKIWQVGRRVSGMEKGFSVRGTNSRGVKDIAVLGGMKFESIASDGNYHVCEVSPQARFKPYPSTRVTKQHRATLGISTGTGSVVTVKVDTTISVPQHKTLLDNLCSVVPLRDILTSPDREIILVDGNRERCDRVVAPQPEGHEVLKERFSVPGYLHAEAKLTIRRAKKRFLQSSPRFRLGGILVKSRHAIHEATLFAPELEHDPHAAWFFGRLTCEHIDTLWNEYDDRYEAGESPSESNPLPIIDPMRKQGLTREHPFVQLLFREALKRFRPLVEEERKRQEKAQAKIANEKTKKRLKALEHEASKFMDENREDDDTITDINNTETDSVFRKKGFSLNPKFAKILKDHSTRFWFNINQHVFPELSTADSVQIQCETTDITVQKQFVPLEPHPHQDDVLRCIFVVKGVKPILATGIKVIVGPIVAESPIEVIESERDKYNDVTKLQFNCAKYSVRVDRGRTVHLLAPYPSLVSEPTPVRLTFDDASFVIQGDMVMHPHDDLGVAICKFNIHATQPERSTTITAYVGNTSVTAELRSVEPPGAGIKIVLEDRDLGDYRSKWRGNVLEIATRHPSIRRYLGSPPAFAGQEELHFRVLLAEVVADAVCRQVVSRNVVTKPDDYSDYDWDAFHQHYTELLSKFLPIAHRSQVENV